ncbi:MAG: hypothetical protein DRO09_03850 [Thermoprotei archaeon]|nr:MAG: hypothetical protein DRO09_03850 [Thermoprotei archaeon]
MGEVLNKLLNAMNGRTTLIYGPAGSGKTNLSLWLLSMLSQGTSNSSTNYFLSTEGMSFLYLIDRFNLEENTLFINIISENHLIDTVLKMLLDSSRRASVIVVDSINSLYRAELATSSRAGYYMNIALALLSIIKRKNSSSVILTAQVKAGDNDVGISGYKTLLFWSDIVIKLVKKEVEREAVLVYPRSLSKLRFKFTVGEYGVRVIS